MLFDSKSTNDFSSVPLLLCSDMRRGVNVERNDTKLNKKFIVNKNVINVLSSITNV